MSGYLDEGSSASPSTLLLAQLQEQGYSRRIPSSHLTGPRIDDIDEEADQVSTTSWDSEEEERQAQEEWDESMKQLNLAIQVMVLPFFGKWLGRKWSYWVFTRYQHHGITSSFFGISWLWAPVSIIPSAIVAALQ